MSLLILSGFEANGMAGLLVDHALATSLEVPVAAIATCQSAQTKHELQAVQPCDPALLARQLDSLAQTPLAIKIGLLVNRETAQVIADWLSTLPLKPSVVIDPIQMNSGDGQVFSPEPLAHRLAPLLPFACLLTPNHDELQWLSSTRDPAKAVTQLHYNADFNGHLLLTGGHAPDADQQAVSDQLFTVNGTEIGRFTQPRLPSPLRGTGCRLSTAIASALAQGYNLPDAVTLGNATLHRVWRLYPTPTASGWSTAVSDYPKVSTPALEEDQALSFPALTVPTGLYPVVDSADWVERLATTDIKTIQLRIKDAPTAQLREEIRQAVAIAQQHNLQLFINDHWQLAIEAGAYGVHLGQEDIADADLTAIARAGLRLGISTHGDFELMRARQLKPSYLAVGAVFPTRTKDMTGQIQGTERLQRYVRLCRNTPVVAIGGIGTDNLDEILDTGATMVAVVTAVTEAQAPERAACDMQRQIQARTERRSW